MAAHLDAESIRAIAEEVADLLARRGEPGPLLTAGQVASRFSVDRRWVYDHAAELGVVRLGAGSRPRLRFDPAVVAQHLLADAPPPGRLAIQPTSAPPAPLLPIRRRSLRGEERARRP
jgi:hypothetical protein